MTGNVRAQHLRPVLQWSPLAGRWWPVVGCALAILTIAALHLEPGDVGELGTTFWLIAGLAVVADLRPIVTAGNDDPQGVNLATAFVFAVLLHWGLAPAVFLVAVGTLVGEATKRKRVWVAVFNTAQYVVTYAAVWAVLRAFDLVATPSAPLDLLGRHLPLVLLAFVVYHATNTLLVCLLLGAEHGRPLRDELVDGWRWYLVTTFAVVALSPLIVAVIDEGPAFILLLLPPLFAVYKTAQMSLRREHQSLHDGLTGLANRTWLVERTGEAIAAARRNGDNAALLLLDLDRFKEVNDTLGHHTGDELLMLVAKRIRGALREQDSVARLGGDEFAVLLPTAGDRVGARAVAERVVTALDEPFHLDGMLLDVQVSIGVALAPVHANDVDGLLRCADVAMYQAKETRSGIEVYALSRDRHTVSRLGMLGELRRALTDGQLVLHYQPKVTLADRRIVGVEALVRWQHPERGIVGPDEFLPLAEQSGLMRPLTDLVVHQALSQAAAWDRQGLTTQVAINVSVRDLSDRAFAASVAGALQRYRLEPSLLLLEITEHALLGDLPRLSVTLDALAEVGVELSLDDFGTGYSSLAHLRHLPVDEVKIDRTFVSRLTEDDIVIVRSIVQLAHNLRMRTVAEGVETTPAWRVLRSLGCDIAQGWLLSRPLPAAAATDCLRRHVSLGEPWAQPRDVAASAASH